MRVQVLQHVPFEGLGSMEPWLKRRGAKIEFAHLYRGGELPELGEIDLAIAMGGPMSVNDVQDHPWLLAEKDWLGEALAAGLPTLGVCLGAQLIAEVLGATVQANPDKEIGWYPVEGLNHSSSFSFPARFSAFHWHGERFGLPDGAQHLARSEACENQAFAYGSHVIGLQFHLETTHATMNGLIERLGHELAPGAWVQSAEQMRAEPAKSFAAIHELMGQVLDYLLNGRT